MAGDEDFVVDLCLRAVDQCGDLIVRGFPHQARANELFGHVRAAGSQLHGEHCCWQGSYLEPSL